MKTLNRVTAIKMIKRWTITLTKAEKIYNYLTCYGEKKITREDIINFFEA